MTFVANATAQWALTLRDRTDCYPFSPCPPPGAADDALARLGTDYLLSQHGDSTPYHSAVAHAQQQLPGASRMLHDVWSCHVKNLGRLSDMATPIRLLIPKTGTRNLTRMYPTQQRRPAMGCPKTVHMRPKSTEYMALAMAGNVERASAACP